MKNIALIGCGAIGSSVLELLSGDTRLQVGWVLVPEITPAVRETAARLSALLQGESLWVSKGFLAKVHGCEVRHHHGALAVTSGRTRVSCSLSSCGFAAYRGSSAIPAPAMAIPTRLTASLTAIAGSIASSLRSPRTESGHTFRRGSKRNETRSCSPRSSTCWSVPRRAR